MLSNGQNIKYVTLYCISVLTSSLYNIKQQLVISYSRSCDTTLITLKVPDVIVFDSECECELELWLVRWWCLPWSRGDGVQRSGSRRNTQRPWSRQSDPRSSSGPECTARAAPHTTRAASCRGRIPRLMPTDDVHWEGRLVGFETQPASDISDCGSHYMNYSWMFNLSKIYNKY